MEYYLAIKNEIMLFAGKWMSLEIITLTETNQYHMWKLDLENQNKTKKDMTIKEGVEGQRMEQKGKVMKDEYA
jgi:hypothetical protein